MTKPGRDYYQNMYQTSSEPWSYHQRGAEILRHELIVKTLKKFKPGYGKVLDIGCSLGQLTEGLLRISRQVVAFDVSELAVTRARARCGASANAGFLVAGLPEMPFQSAAFDLVVAADALHEFVSEDNRRFAAEEIHRSLKPGGHALFTDYLKTEKFQAYLDLLQSCRFQIAGIYPLDDRLWYQFESWFKAVRGLRTVKKILASVAIARLLRYPARLWGRNGSRHILILAQK